MDIIKMFIVVINDQNHMRFISEVKYDSD